MGRLAAVVLAVVGLASGCAGGRIRAEASETLNCPAGQISLEDKGKNTFWGRPTDVMLMPDGSVLVSDEQMGAIYRVSYKR